MKYTHEQVKKNRQQWVEALRGNKYKKGTFRLKRGDYYCALGVACDLASKVGVCKKSKDEFDRQTHNLPESVQDWLNVDECGSITKSIPFTREDDDGRQFTYHLSAIQTLSDNGVSFLEIAKLIEAGFLSPKPPKSKD